MLAFVSVCRAFVGAFQGILQFIGCLGTRDLKYLNIFDFGSFLRRNTQNLERNSDRDENRFVLATLAFWGNSGSASPISDIGSMIS